MSGELFSSEPFEQYPGQLSMEQRTWDGEPLWSPDSVREHESKLWFRFTPDSGPTTSFSADSVEDAQRFAAEYFHGRVGIIEQLEIRS